MRRSYKSDESFLEKLAAGAIGVRQVIKDLEQQGHQPIELERGSTSFKLWKEIKIKRIRVPDILCVRCGHCIESRAKTQFEVSMSHSPTDPERSWDYGLRDDDAVAIVVCNKTGNRPIDWQADNLVQYVRVGNMREAQKKGSIVQPQTKGVEEGFELRIVWPTLAATSAGKVMSIEPNQIKYQRDSDRRTITLRLTKQKQKLKPLVKAGETIKQYQAIASVVDISHEYSCSDEQKTVQSYLEQLQSKTLSERYSAAKAMASLTLDQDTINKLVEHIDNKDEHVFVRLEIAATLARKQIEIGQHFIEQCLRSDDSAYRLESVIVLSEIKDEWARSQLHNILQIISNR